MSRTVYLIQQRIEGERLLARVRQIVHEGYCERVIVKTDGGAVLMEIPMHAITERLLPLWAALGAMAPVAAFYRLVITKVSSDRQPARLAARENWSPLLVGA